MNEWYLKHREGSPLQIEDWETFRDPDKLNYRSYVSLQHQRETVMDGIVDEYERRDHDATLGADWAATLTVAFAPARFAIHALQMAALYLGQVGPSAFITNAAHFQAGDEMRRIQWLAYRCKSLSLAGTPELVSSTLARNTWENDERWQPARKLLEELLIAYDWGEAFAALNLTVKPVLDIVLNEELALVAEANGDGLLASMQREHAHDSERSQRWSKALVATAVAGADGNRDHLQKWVDQWSSAAYDAADGLRSLLADAPVAPQPALLGRSDIVGRHEAFLASCELGR
ncbi:toluene hydroxylase [Pseudonocardia benzenivorans]